MKRKAWWGLGLSLTAAMGCGEDDKGGGGNAGQPDASVEDWQDEIDDLNDQLDELGGKVDDLDGELGGKIDDLTGRVDDLEEIPSCSEGELCIPDGIDLANTGFAPVVQALCERETNCCDAGELKYLYGVSVTTTEDCVATFTDMINNGWTPEFLELDGDEVPIIIEAARALNDTEVRVAINAAGVTACAEAIAAVPCELDDDEPEEEGCSPSEPDSDWGPCSLQLMLTGLEGAGDTCNPESEVPECGEGLVCRYASGNYYGDQSGICAPRAEAGDRCTADYECDELYCDHASGTCKVRAKLGETCAYVDPSFEDVDPWEDESSAGNGSATSIDCERHLSCDPISNTCVPSHCGDGSFCYYNSDCPTGKVCSRVAYEPLSDVSSSGLCADPSDVGEECVEFWNGDTNCASERCFDHDENGTSTCQPALKADGATCADGDECDSGYCGTDLKCAARCNWECEGEDDCEICAAGTYCGASDYCLPLRPNGNGCDGTLGYPHDSCSSGFCNLSSAGGNDTCAAKSAANGACASGLDEQCQTNQFCNESNTCATAKAIGATCASDDECGNGVECHDTTNGGQAADYKCYTLEGDLPNGTYCGSDYQCESGWCSESFCKARIAIGEECDLDDSTKDECVYDAYCAYGEESYAGTCKQLGRTGEACDPFYDGYDCYGGWNCEYVREQFLCGQYAQPEGETFCKWSNEPR